MTELLFLNDSYIKDFECHVVEIDEEESAVVLDKSAFFPGGGGQLCDRGMLVGKDSAYPVESVKKKGAGVYHYINGELPERGEALKGIIDWDYRYDIMKTHTAMHILCGVVWRDYRVQVTGVNMDVLKGRMDFEFPNLDKELIEEIEEKINVEVTNKREIHINFLEREEAFKIPDLIRTKINLLPEGIREIRTIDIEGLDIQADGGTHLINTSEVGRISIVGYKNKGKSNKRIFVEIEKGGGSDE
ncbi:Ala-tRNA(Pro) hydrolase [Peptoclostridium litorale DSM 5388]|uniref:Alanyl-tRNA editing protein AlaX-M n=1 Tax=Peptoclostridium litorale DSM 5388 TaxID=1121324 RepID=A0A069RH72_PEPLI|nr:alanyl-tRNA editing protein [Peptoclostridium litorale]KDR95520.1 alanyl-tRNA editing protein AlaX-M [Peptoclostridium litorale DSM 5388]SIO16931.1 Ala-tRNA(Pro) hydrolase [Peptoclostridium litorale DSM 5388]